MEIDYKAPRVFLLDVSLLLDTVDRDNSLSPLAWQYCIEHDLDTKSGLNVLKSISPFPSLMKQIALIAALQELHKFNITHCLPIQLVTFLANTQVEIKINHCAMTLIAG